MPTAPRILLYSHDTYGLGHLRRSLSVADQLAADIPRVHQLLITGSMVAGAFGLPPRLDMIKLPALSKRSSGRYKARALPLSLRNTLAWREQMIMQAVANFKPSLVLVDKVAGGVHGELLPALRYLRTWSPGTRIVLGMRDIEDSPAVTRAEWAADGVPDLLEQVYDAILLYGQRAVFDPLTAYGMTPAAAAKVIECGYLRRAATARSADSVRRELNCADRPLIVVTVGGGGDGHDIVRHYLDMLGGRDAPDRHSVVVTGPLMSESKRRALARQAKGLPVTLLAFTPDLLSYMAAADVVVSMAGYNTVCEILSLGKRAVLIPRTRVREEQLLRADGLARRGLATVIAPADLTPDRLRAAVDAALSAPPPVVDLNLDGLARAGAALARLVAQDSAESRPLPAQVNPFARAAAVSAV